jgi:hypothetical protein
MSKQKQKLNPATNLVAGLVQNYWKEGKTKKKGEE